MQRRCLSEPPAVRADLCAVTDRGSADWDSFASWLGFSQPETAIEQASYASDPAHTRVDGRHLQGRVGMLLKQEVLLAGSALAIKAKEQHTSIRIARPLLPERRP